MDKAKDPSNHPEWANAHPEAAAMMEIAIQVGRLADATVLLARATAGEFDEPEQVPDPAKPGQGMGMGG